MKIRTLDKKTLFIYEMKPNYIFYQYERKFLLTI